MGWDKPEAKLQLICFMPLACPFPEETQGCKGLWKHPVKKKMIKIGEAREIHWGEIDRSRSTHTLSQDYDNLFLKLLKASGVQESLWSSQQMQQQKYEASYLGLGLSRESPELYCGDKSLLLLLLLLLFWSYVASVGVWLWEREREGEMSNS